MAQRLKYSCKRKTSQPGEELASLDVSFEANWHQVLLKRPKALNSMTIDSSKDNHCTILIPASVPHPPFHETWHFFGSSASQSWLFTLGCRLHSNMQVLTIQVLKRLGQNYKGIMSNTGSLPAIQT